MNPANHEPTTTVPDAVTEPAATETTMSQPTSVPDTVPFDQFAALDIRIGTIESVAIVPDTDKLLQLTVAVGEDAPRTIVSGIREFFPDEQVLVGRQCPFVLNLPQRNIRGVVSQGMILAAGEDTFSLLHPDTALSPGTPIR